MRHIVATNNTLICLQGNVWKEEGRIEIDSKTLWNFDINKRDCKFRKMRKKENEKFIYISEDS